MFSPNGTGSVHLQSVFALIRCAFQRTAVKRLCVLAARTGIGLLEKFRQGEDARINLVRLDGLLGENDLTHSTSDYQV